MRQNTKAFQENLSTIFDELHLAKQWGKASIILTIHKTTLSKEKTEKVLQKKLGDLGFRIVKLEVNKVNGNFIDEMLKYGNIENVVFNISNIDWGSGKDQRDSYRVLNLYRETFIEQNLKVIFFLTSLEATKLPNFAPDFWAFRHRVLEFGSPHIRSQNKPPIGLMLWHIESSIAPIIDLKSKISMLTKMFAEIPDQAEGVSLRVDLLYELSFLYWRLGDHISAEKELTQGIKLADTYQLTNQLVKLLNGLAIMYYEQENYQGALELLEPLTKENPRDCSLFLNQAIALFAMKKRYEAITKGKKATTLCADNSWAWNSLGFLYYLAGELDEAASCFQKAIDISPKAGYFCESLAICYLAIGLKDKANALLHQAQTHSTNREVFQDVLKKCINGERGKALFLTNTAVDAGELTKLDVARDPTLNVLIGPEQVSLNGE